MLCRRIISGGILNTRKWEVKQAYFLLPFAVSTGIKLNRKQHRFVSLSLQGRGTDTDRLWLSPWIERSMRTLVTMGGEAIVIQSCRWMCACATSVQTKQALGCP